MTFNILPFLHFEKTITHYNFITFAVLIAISNEIRFLGYFLPGIPLHWTKFNKKYKYLPHICYRTYLVGLKIEHNYLT